MIATKIATTRFAITVGSASGEVPAMSPPSVSRIYERDVSVARGHPCHAMWSAAKTITRRLVAMERCSDRTSAVIDGCDRMTALSVQAR
jgi:hypothetical protein